MGAELDVFANRLTEWFVIRQAGFIERLEVERDEPLALIVRDPQVSVDVMMCWKPSLLVNRSGPPNDSAVNQVR